MGMRLTFHIGTIGFAYPGWQPRFYPAGTRSGDFLSSYAAVFDTVELDTTFYGTPPASRVEGWAREVGEGFLFCPKTPRQVTHEMPLEAALPGMLGFVESLGPMRAAGKLGPVLIQFPGFLTQASEAKLGKFLAGLPVHTRYAIEFRHRSWLRPSTEKLLGDYGSAFVAADYSETPWPIQSTTDFLYLRFVGTRDRFAGDGPEQIDTTAQLRARLEEAMRVPNIGGVARIFVLLANDYAGHAPATANRFRRLVGLETREVAPREAEQGELF